jgi:glycine C-acetyltransferase
MRGGQMPPLINCCSNDYLSLANERAVVEAMAQAMQRFGAGMASVRFISGTSELHLELEAAIADYVGQEDAILFGSAFDANGGVFEALLDERDAIVSDSLNHASIIDGIRLCKARRYRFPNADLAALEERLVEARHAGARMVLIVTDGVFSMDGVIAPVAQIVELAVRFDAAVMIDDCHATGVIGTDGRGSACVDGSRANVDIVSGTLGKALGGTMGGFIAANRRVVATLRARSRPYLFSNALPPGVCAAALAAIRIARGPEGERRRSNLLARTRQLRDGLARHGFSSLGATHPITPVRLSDADQPHAFADTLLSRGVLARAFTFPVVPRGQPRIRLQPCAAHSREDIDTVVSAFVAARETSVDTVDGNTRAAI